MNKPNHLDFFDKQLPLNINHKNVIYKYCKLEP